MRLPWKVKKLIELVVGEDRVHNKADYKPDFSPASFAQFGLERTILTPDVIVEWALRHRKTDFFVPLNQVLSLAQQVDQNFPHWKQNILQSARKTCEEGYWIYHREVAPLSAIFDWHGLQKGPCKDQLYMSRPQRFGFAPVIAQAALFDREYLSKLDGILAGWLSYAETCPYRWPYNSSHALMYRAIALAWCWLFVAALHQQSADKHSRSVLFRILAIVKNDICYLAPRLGQAHPNNHLLADFFSGWFLHHEFAHLIPATEDFSGYEQRYQQELLRQFYSDGGNFEHAVHYHEHGCEMAVIYRLLKGEAALPEEVKQRINMMMAFQVRLAGDKGQPWALGDTTEDTLLPLDQSTGWSIDVLHNVSQLWSGKNIINRPVKPEPKSYWLLCGIFPNTAGPEVKKGYILPVSGYCHWMEPCFEQELLFRSGVQPQTQFMPGHMAADCLSLYWRVKGIDILAAPGTYSYKFSQRNEGNFRRHFCGPWSHSTLCVNNEDPLGELGGDFRDIDNGLRVFQQHSKDVAWVDLCTAQIQSENLYDQTIRCVLHFQQGVTLVIDNLSAALAALPIYSHWQFSEEIELSPTPLELKVFAQQQPLASIMFAGPVRSKVVKGEVNPPQGWISRSYGMITQACSVTTEFDPGQQINAHLLVPDGINVDKFTIYKEELNSKQYQLIIEDDYYHISVGKASKMASIQNDELAIEGHLVVINHGEKKLACAFNFELNNARSTQHITTNQWYLESESKQWKELI